ncbi:hypothetical protein MUP29_11165 [bacterium]|nr:hypothetical protein [bacterium]
MIKRFEEMVIGNVMFPATSALYNRKRILPLYRQFKASEFYPPERLEEMQLEKLRKLVCYAYHQIPFYKKHFDEAGIQPGDIRNTSDLKNLPAVTRQDVIDHHHDMVDNRFRSSALRADAAGRAAGAPILLAPLRKDRLVRNTSSGSTGAPTTFYEDGARTAMNWAHELRLRNWYGIPPGAREARMARVSVEYLKNSKDVLMRRLLWNQLALPGVNLGEEDFSICYESLEKFRPRVLWGFTSALTGLAAYIREAGLDAEVVRPELIITWAAPMYEHEERILKEVFECHVTNIYGAREVGHIAARCPDETLHINEENLLLEVEPGEDLKENGGGEILVTTLDTTIMPFIRYRMGDIGKVSPSRCSCGRSLAVLEDLLGRTGEIFVTQSGRMISPNFWCRTFMNPDLGGKIERFQVVYRPEDTILIRIVKGTGFTKETEEGLRRHLQNNFKGSVTPLFEYRDEIQARISGKYEMVVNETQS